MVESRPERDGQKAAGGDACGRTGAAPGKLTWSVRPCTMNWLKFGLVSAVILGFGFLVQLAFGDVFLAVLSIAILVGSLHSYFFETSYSLSPEGIEVRGVFGRQRKPWTGFKSFSVDRAGLSLSPFARRSWLEHYRGARLFFGVEGSGGRDEVVGYVTEKLGKEARRGQRVTPVP